MRRATPFALLLLGAIDFSLMISALVGLETVGGPAGLLVLLLAAGVSLHQGRRHVREGRLLLFLRWHLVAAGLLLLLVPATAALVAVVPSFLGGLMQPAGENWGAAFALAAAYLLLMPLVVLLLHPPLLRLVQERLFREVPRKVALDTCLTVLAGMLVLLNLAHGFLPVPLELLRSIVGTGM